MSINRFFHAIDPQKLEEFLQNPREINDFLDENTQKYADTGFTNVYRALQKLITSDENFSTMDYPTFQPNAEMDLDNAGVYRFNVVPDIYESLSSCNFTGKVEEYFSDLDYMEQWEIDTGLKRIFEVFKFANENKLSVVSYVG